MVPIQFSWKSFLFPKFEIASSESVFPLYILYTVIIVHILNILEAMIPVFVHSQKCLKCNCNFEILVLIFTLLDVDSFIVWWPLFCYFSYELGSGLAVILTEKPVNDGSWHTIQINRYRQLLLIIQQLDCYFQ